MTRQPAKLLYFITEDWFFCSHFIDRAVAARQAGHDVLVLTRTGSAVDTIRAAGLRVIPLDIRRRSLNPFGALANLARVADVYRRERPDIVHHVALKPILLGSLAARMAGIPRVVNAVVGMGFAFTSDRWLARVLRPGVSFALRLLLNAPGSKVVFENQDDLGNFVARSWVRAESAVLIRGAGVDPDLFVRAAPAAQPPVVMLVARMLWDKGIGEFVEAARLLRGSGARFVLIGDIDDGNRAAIPRQTLEAWHAEGAVEWWGFRADIPAALAQATIACLPSYREGLPKSLLESMAAGLPCVTTDVPGCREIVRHGDNGLLVPPRDAAALAAALKYLMKNPELCQHMGERGRERIEQELSKSRVVEQTLGLYREVLSR